MSKVFHTTVAAFLLIILTLGTGCNSSEELLHYNSPVVVQRKGNIRFIEDINLKPTTAKKLQTITGTEITAENCSELPDELLQKYSTMLGLVPKAMSNYLLYQFIDEWYGVKYSYGGEDKSGIDCSAFVQKLYEQVFGTELVRTSREQFHSCKMIWDIDNLIEGDLVFFKTRGKRISHVGIYLANNFFVHASSSSGVMISNLTDSYWSKRYAGAGKIPKGSGQKQVL